MPNHKAGAVSGHGQVKVCISRALHVLDAEKGSRDMRRSFICYEALIDDWRSVAQGLARDLDITWPQETDQGKAAIDHFLSGDLQPLKAASAEDRTEPPLPPVVAELQDMLGSWAGGADPARDSDRLDVLTNRVERMKEELSTAIAARDQARKEAQEALEWGRRREAELLGSTSWRVTSPLRALSRASLRLRH